MAALVVVDVSPASGTAGAPARLGIFPGGPTPTMFTADLPFWVGYGFAADPGPGGGLDEASTRFELDIDGVPAQMLTEVRSDRGRPLRRSDVAEFPRGLPAGWHDFAGRWYDGGRLILSSRTTIQFVDA